MFEFKQHPRPDLCHVRYCRREHYKRSRFCPKHMKQWWRHLHPVHDAYLALKLRARRRKQIFTLTITQWIDFVEETAYMDGKGRWRHCFHVDRKKPEKGYTFSNIQMLSCPENVAKGNKERRQALVNLKRNKDVCPF